MAGRPSWGGVAVGVVVAGGRGDRVGGDAMTGLQDDITAITSAADRLRQRAMGASPAMAQRLLDARASIADALFLLTCVWCETRPGTVDRGFDGFWCAACDEKQADDDTPGPDEDAAYEQASGK